jgi:hypothetical protein
MAITRRVGIVAVGVDKASKLTPLDGAASGAADFADWFKANQGPLGVDVQAVLITDADGAEVKAEMVKDAAQDFVDKRQIDVLILYLSAHGLIKSVGEEHVLLTNVAKYQNQAINIAQTAENARTCGLDHVIIVSDACRTPVVPGGFLDQVSGLAAIDRGTLVGGAKTPVDIFYASEPTQPAYEADGVGFFTKILLSVLKSCPTDICETFKSLPEGSPVIPSWLLGDYLENAVPIAASRNNPPFSQTPDMRVMSHEPRFFAYPGDATKGDALGDDAVFHLIDDEAVGDAELPLPVLPHVQAMRDLAKLPNAGEAAAVLLLDRAGIAVPSRILLEDETPARRTKFETSTGYVVVGAKVTSVVGGSTISAGLIDTLEGTDVRLYPTRGRDRRHGHWGSILVEFDGKTLGVFPVMPGYIGVIELQDGRVQSLAFQLSKDEQKYLGLSDREIAEVRRRRLMAKELSASGRLWRIGTEKANQHASYFREGKRLDPTLGVYGAYAYAAAGNDEGSQSIFRWFAQEYWDRPSGLPAAPVPFDVELLAGQLTPQSAIAPPGFAPFCPMMTLGWSYLESRTFENPLHPAILAAAEHRLSCEWTTFKTRDVRAMIKAFERGEIL